MGAVRTEGNDVVGQTGMRARVAPYVPILTWARTYQRDWWGRDAVAGLTLWGLLVPQGMAYAGIAGLPPQAGLYTLVASLVYALFGTSRHLSVGATSATSALLASSALVAVGVTTVDDADPSTYQAYASAFVLVTGLVFLAAGLAKLGFITQFLSKPVMDGFVLGLALFVAVGQLNKLFGVPKPEGNTVQKFLGIIKELPDANWADRRGRLRRAVPALRAAPVEPADPRRAGGALRRHRGQPALDLSGQYDVAVMGNFPRGCPP